MENCIFCKIIVRQLPGYIISENDKVIVFQSRDNHPLVVPKVHIQDIYGLDEVTGGEIMKEVIRVAKAVKQGMACEGVYITQANEAAAGQDVFHIHFHVYPRWADQPWTPGVKASDEEREATVEKIRQALG